MNYFNIFIIIFTIDVIIYLIEGIVFFTYGAKLFADEFKALVNGKLSNLGSLFYPKLSKTNTQKQNEIFNSCVNAEINYNKEQQTKSILYFSLSIILLAIIIIFYLWVVNKLFGKEIDYKKSAIVVGIVVFFIIILEIFAIFVTLKDYGPNSYDLTLFLDNKLIYLLTE
jgi:hypothetical protein